MRGQGWRFGSGGQTAKQEKDEIKQAKRAGLEREYMDGQRWARLREAERERKRLRKIERRA